MSKSRLLIFMSLIAALAIQAPVGVFAQLPSYADPGGVPHYFGPYGNWAFSPLPKGTLNPALTVDSGGSGYAVATTTVTINDAYDANLSDTAMVAVDAAGAITAITLNPGGSGTGYSAPVVTITGAGTGAAATANLTGLTGGMRKFVDGMPGLTPDGANALGQYIPVATPQGWPLGCESTNACTADYYEIALVEYAEKMHSDLPATRMRGYVQLSTTGSGNTLTNPSGSPIMMPDGVTPAKGLDNPHYLGPVIVAKGRAHGVAGAAGDPKPVRIKFYNLLPAGTGGNLFLPVDESVMGSGMGPALPGAAGDKFSQNRATIHLHGNNTIWISDGNVHQWITPANEATPYPKGVSVRNVPDMLDVNGNVECDAANSGCMTFFYTNAQSARLQFYHDHAMGITRLNVYAGEAAGYVLTDAVEQDMINGTNVSGVNPGLLKVLPDIGIPLVIQDRTFVDANTIWAQDPTWNGGTGPRTNGNITGAVTGDLWYPHVYMTVQNPWDLTGTNGLGRWHYGPWFQPPTPVCVNGQPVGCIENGPVPNEYCLPRPPASCVDATGSTNPGVPGVDYDCSTFAWEPPCRPGNPNPSMPGESFLDTSVVNGTAYPYLEVEPRAYRFRVLNAANDRMYNLQLYEAYDKTSWVPGTGPAAPGSPTVPCGADPTVCTEVKMVPVSVAPANQYADTPSGIPDPATKGPDWILIGTEGGFMPKPVVVPQQPVGYNLDPAYFAFGIVNQHSLFLGSAERADVVVDFTNYAGKTLILYNDAPAPVPAGAAPYDFYTGNGNQMDGGGAPNTQPGYGPNTRTVMQIRVTKPVTTPTPGVTLANLEAVFAKTGTKPGVFELTQDPIIVPQAAYDSAYNAALPSTVAEQYLQIGDKQKTFQPLGYDAGTGAWGLQSAVTLPLEMKAMHDEMGGVYDTQFGRMSGMLGLSIPDSPIHVLIPYGLASPPTDLVKGSLEATPISVQPDGTQIWRIFHNGVDTHTIHTHLFHTQLINRIGQDGQWYDPDRVDPIELGWKDTFRVNPLEVTFLAMRPTIPTPSQLPFEVPDSVRLIDPTLPEGATLIPPPPAGWFDPAGNNIPEILNHYVNFGWEYVWHCHILSHEEMDMMHSLVFVVAPKAPTGLTAAVTGNANNPRVNLIWTDNSIRDIGFTVERATNANFTSGLRTFNVGNPNPAAPSQVSFQDSTVTRNTQYWYRVIAHSDVIGDTGTPGFQTMSADSASNTVTILTGAAPTAPLAPTNLTAALQAGPQVSLTWRDNANNETGFVVERCAFVAPATTCSSNSFAQIAAPGPRNNTGNVTYVDTTVAVNTGYLYRVAAFNAGGTSSYATLANAVVVPGIPVAPDSLTVAAVRANGNKYTATLTWTLPAGAPTPAGFTIQRAENLDFTTNLNTTTVAGNLRTTTQTVSRNTVYYYRIRANNNAGGFSAWKNALPFPIRTGP